MPLSETLYVQPRGLFTVEVLTTVKNNGPFAITFEKLGAPVHPPVPHGAKNVREYVYTTRKDGSLVRAPLHSFTLAAHSSRVLSVEYQQSCTLGNPTLVPLVVSGLPATYSFLGLSHTVMVPVMPFAIAPRAVC